MLVVAAFCRALAMRQGDFPVFAHVEWADLLPAALMAACVALATGRFRFVSLAIWLLLSGFGLAASFAASGWGDTVMDASEAYERHYATYTAFSAGLLALSSAILLIAGLALAWLQIVDRTTRRRVR